MGYKRILVPVSFAPSCKKAIRMAAGMAVAYGSRLLVLNVYKKLPRMFYSAGGALYSKDIERQREDAIKELERFVHHELYGTGIKLNVEEMEVLEDDPVTGILGVAKEKDVDLIILGHHEESRLEHILFGRNIDRIIKRAPCDVIVTRTPLEDIDVIVPAA